MEREIGLADGFNSLHVDFWYTTIRSTRKTDSQKDGMCMSVCMCTVCVCLLYSPWCSKSTEISVGWRLTLVFCFLFLFIPFLYPFSLDDRFLEARLRWWGRKDPFCIRFVHGSSVIEIPLCTLFCVCVNVIAMLTTFPATEESVIHRHGVDSLFPLPFI